MVTIMIIYLNMTLPMFSCGPYMNLSCSGTFKVTIYLKDMVSYNGLQYITCQSCNTQASGVRTLNT